MSFWVAGSIAAAAVVTAGAGVYSANKAAGAQKDAANNASAAQEAQYQQTRADLEPYRTSGSQALTRLNDILYGKPGSNTPDYSSFYKSPGYNFAMSEGTRGIERSAAARSGAASGNTLRALTRFKTGLAQQGFGDYYNRVAGMANLGENAAAQTGAFGANKANGVANNYLAAGDASAAGTMGATNSITEGINSGLNNYLLYKGGYFTKQPTAPAPKVA